MTEPSAPIQAVLFDADGVIQWPREGWLERFTELGGDGFIDEAFEAELRTLTGQVDLKPLLAELLEHRGRQATAEQVIDAWCRIDRDEAVLAIVDRLRVAGVTTVLATNQQHYRGSYMRAELGYDQHFDALFYSDQVGLAKPDPAFFNHIADTIGHPVDQLLFVDDLDENVAGARTAGLNAEVHPRGEPASYLRDILIRYGVPGA